jgi:UDP-3-O-[3-hydroxymyristoyl] glucosamine N-acyltransferase
MAQGSRAVTVFGVSEIAGWARGRVANADALPPGALERIGVERPSPLAGSRATELAYFFSKHYQPDLPSAAPGILVTGEAFVGPLSKSGLPLWKTSAVIACDDPYLAMALLSEKFAARLSSVAHLSYGTARGPKSVHPSAVVDPTAELGEGVQVGPHVVIEAGARIGAGTVLYAGCFVGPRCVIGEDSVLFPRVTLYEWTELGRRARVHAGAVLGADGFGFAPRREGGKLVGHQKIHHLGRVVVGDDVEIGANTCVDRGTVGETRLENQVKLDNLVQVGHNARVGEGTCLCGSAAMAGSASTGRFVYVGGLTGITNQVHVGDEAQVGALSLVTKDVEPGGTAVGNPQRDYREHFRAHASLNRLAKGKGKTE